jgi:hypothetical protein
LRGWSSPASNLVELLPLHLVAGSSVAGNPIDGPLADLKLAELFGVAPHDELHIRVEDDAGRKVELHFVRGHEGNGSCCVIFDAYL